MKRKIVFLVILFLSISIKSEILFKVSGKVVFQGTGISNIEIQFVKQDGDFVEKTISNASGDWFLYVPNGIYNVSVGCQNSFVSTEGIRTLTVYSKNINNAIFFLEKGCKLSGNVKYADGTPVMNTQVIAFNERGASKGVTNQNGNFAISCIKASTNTKIKMISPGAATQQKIIPNVVEGESIANIDFIVSNRISIQGVIVDKETQAKIDDISVNILNEQGDMIASNTTLNGKYTIYGMEPGTYNLVILHPEYNYLVEKILYKENEIKNINFELQKMTQVPEGDVLLEAQITTGNNEIILGTYLGKALKFNERDVRAMGRGARGVTAIKLAKDDFVVGADVIGEKGKHILTVTENGFGKKSELSLYRLQKRGGKGLINIKITEKLGKVIGLVTLHEDDCEIILSSEKGILNKQDALQIRSKGRATQGVKLINLKPGDRLVAIEKVTKEAD